MDVAGALGPFTVGLGRGELHERAHLVERQLAGVRGGRDRRARFELTCGRDVSLGRPGVGARLPDLREVVLGHRLERAEVRLTGRARQGVESQAFALLPVVLEHAA